ncbi:hypothetical protein [Schumannella soli]|uniref:Uncharacterized protein n=1 Tax=Schumannella soli TaxID=2590779 RepID=A0A506Y6H2_9MICO|nr:hypothetical protein [Schumannella soli]TPW77473.1 hypothetical protein FJ657_01975 [Schumannella soli]
MSERDEQRVSGDDELASVADEEQTAAAERDDDSADAAAADDAGEGADVTAAAPTLDDSVS